MTDPVLPPEERGEAAKRVFHLLLTEAVTLEFEMLELLWRGDTFTITLSAGGRENMLVSPPPESLWSDLFEHIREVTTWIDTRAGLIALSLDDRMLTCHVVARANDLSHREYQLLFEPAEVET